MVNRLKQRRITAELWKLRNQEPLEVNVCTPERLGFILDLIRIKTDNRWVRD